MTIKRLLGNPWTLALAGPTSPAAPAQAMERSGLGLLLAQGAGDSDPDKKRTVRAGRRRRSEPSAGAGRERAAAPRRKRADAPARPTQPPGGAGGGVRPPRPTGGALPGGRNPLLLIGLLVLLVVCGLPILLLTGGPQDSGQPSDVAFAPPTPASDAFDFALAATPTTAPTRPSEPFLPPVPASEGDTWLVMLYQDADDKILEQDIYVDLNEAERIGSSDRVHIVAQIDRFRAGYQGDGDWSAARRFYITQDNDLQRVRSQQVADLGEVNMADGDTLIDFVTWAIETFPADKHALILSDHGMGWPGGWSDPAPGGRGDPSIPLAAALGDELYLMEIDDALAEIRARTGLEQFELIGMDACLMGHLEVFSALAPHARYAVASQETEPALGWAYTSFLGALTQNPSMSGADLSRLIVESYIQDDQRIVDDQARADLLRQGGSMNGLFGLFGEVTADRLAQQMEQNITLTAADLTALPALMASVNDLSFALQGAKQSNVAQARTYAQSFTSIFGSRVPPSYIDLGNFAQLLKRESGDQAVGQAVDRLLAALDRTVITERHGPNKPGATGVSIYFPNSQLYASPAAGPESYTAIARRFATDSLWDDFLAFHYTGRPFEAAAGAIALPERGTAISAPGSGQVQLSPLTLSSSTAAPGRPVLLSADVSGQNIGHVYLFVGFYDRQSNAIFVADRDYLESADTRQIDGVYYPDWGEGEFTLEFEWEPIVFAIDDGVNSVLALFTPQAYGASPEEAVYTVEGVYTYGDGGESRYARLYFSAGSLQQVFGFTGEGGMGSPREIIPQRGDKFTVLERWMDLDQNGRVAQVSTQEGGVLTFGAQTLAWEELDAAPGDYIVGFIVEDLDGAAYETYQQVRVE